MAKNQRQRRQPEGEAEIITWTPRKRRGRAGTNTAARKMEMHMLRRVAPDEKFVSDSLHFNRATQRLGDEEEPDTWKMYDPIHGLVTLRGVEDELYKTKLLGRLRHVMQLEGMLASVFPGSTNDRLQHAVGAMHLAGRIAQRLKLSKKTQAKLRLAALLHDVGHAAFSHASEPFIQQETGKDHDEIAEELMKKAGVPKILSRHGLDFEEILRLSRGHGVGEIVTEFADRMDYLQRDAKTTGGITEHLRRELKLTIEDVIRNLRAKNGKLYLIKQGEPAFRKLADFRSAFFAGIYFHPSSMVTRHFLRRSIAQGMTRKIITAQDLIQGTDERIIDRLAKAGIKETGLFPSCSSLEVQTGFRC